MKINLRILFIVIIGLLAAKSNAQQKVLFDCTKAETARDADWQIDSDVFNLGFDTNGYARVGLGNDANPQQRPTPTWQEITGNSVETVWNGALSSWALTLARYGYEPQTLPFNGRITFGDTSNAQDLSHYKMYVVVEPNSPFTLEESNAIVRYVYNGGSLFMIANGSSSDRNADGTYTPIIWNTMMDSNTVQVDPFGFHFQMVNISELSRNFAQIRNDTILNGIAGPITSINFASSATIKTSAAFNATSRGLIYKNDVSNAGDSGIFLVRSIYGAGRVVGLADSYLVDDGTGDRNDRLNFSWLGEVNGNHGRLITNATAWLLRKRYVAVDEKVITAATINLTKTQHDWSVRMPCNGQVSVYDLVGKMLWQKTGAESEDIEIPIFSGVAIMHIEGERQNGVIKLVP